LSKFISLLWSLSLLIFRIYSLWKCFSLVASLLLYCTAACLVVFHLLTFLLAHRDYRALISKLYQSIIGDSQNSTECTSTTKPNPCGANSIECINEVPGYRCICKSGYEDQSGVCRDIQECTANLDNCNDFREVCFNEDGSFRCDCKAGFVDNGGTPKCEDINECTETTNICGVNGDCANTVGSYTCKCKVDFPGGTPPNCRKLNEYEACPSGSDNDCQTGLVCATTSFSDLTTTTCCSKTKKCNVNQECCEGVYVSGEECPAGVQSDCRPGLECANRGLFDGTLVCCRSTLPVLGSPTERFCIAF